MLSDIRYAINTLEKELDERGNTYSMDDVVYKLDELLGVVDEVEGKIEKKIEDLESEKDYYIECYHEEIGC